MNRIVNQFFKFMLEVNLHHGFVYTAFRLLNKKRVTVKRLEKLVILDKFAKVN